MNQYILFRFHAFRIVFPLSYPTAQSTIFHFCSAYLVFISLTVQFRYVRFLYNNVLKILTSVVLVICLFRSIRLGGIAVYAHHCHLNKTNMRHLMGKTFSVFFSEPRVIPCSMMSTQPTDLSLMGKWILANDTVQSSGSFRCVNSWHCLESVSVSNYQYCCFSNILRVQFDLYVIIGQLTFPNIRTMNNRGRANIRPSPRF